MFSADLLPPLLLLLPPPPPSSSPPSNAVEQRATRTLTVGSGLSDILLHGLKVLPPPGRPERPFLEKHWPHVAEDGNCTLKKFTQQDRQLRVSPLRPPPPPSHLCINLSDLFFFFNVPWGCDQEPMADFLLRWRLNPRFPKSEEEPETHL